MVPDQVFSCPPRRFRQVGGGVGELSFSETFFKLPEKMFTINDRLSRTGMTALTGGLH